MKLNPVCCVWILSYAAVLLSELIHISTFHAAQHRKASDSFSLLKQGASGGLFICVWVVFMYELVLSEIKEEDEPNKPF